MSFDEILARADDSESGSFVDVDFEYTDTLKTKAVNFH